MFFFLQFFRLFYEVSGVKKDFMSTLYRDWPKRGVGIHVREVSTNEPYVITYSSQLVTRNVKKKFDKLAE